jgi:hypothetical protein
MGTRDFSVIVRSINISICVDDDAVHTYRTPQLWSIIVLHRRLVRSIHGRIPGWTILDDAAAAHCCWLQAKKYLLLVGTHHKRFVYHKDNMTIMMANKAMPSTSSIMVQSTCGGVAAPPSN